MVVFEFDLYSICSRYWRSELCNLILLSMQRSINKTSRRWRTVELTTTNRLELTTWYTSWLDNIDYVHILQCIAAYTFCQWFLVINQNKPSRRLNQKRFRQKLKVIFIVDLSQNHAIWIDIKRQRLKIELKMEIAIVQIFVAKRLLIFFKTYILLHIIKPQYFSIWNFIIIYK